MIGCCDVLYIYMTDDIKINKWNRFQTVYRLQNIILGIFFIIHGVHWVTVYLILHKIIG